jgi:hypothetical protein
LAVAAHWTCPDADGKAIERWDTLQVVGAPNNAAPWLAPNIPSANPNGMF